MIRILLVIPLLFMLRQLPAQLRALPEVNVEELVSHAGLSYNVPVDKSEEGLPVGNGRMGSLVWTTPSAIRMQLNRVDVFANNSASNNFYERHTDYCNGVGFVDVDFLNDSTFIKNKFRQSLSCYDGLVGVEGSKIKANVFAWQEHDVMVMQVQSNRAPSGDVHINLRMLRAPVTRRGNHLALSSLRVIENKIVLVQEFTEDQYYCASSVVIELTGTDAKASIVNETTVRVTILSGKNNFSVLMATAASFNVNEDVVSASIKKLDQAKSVGVDRIYQSNRSWWKDFWEKSYVELHSNDGIADLVEENYTYYLYVMASSSRGSYPPKFNGMLWSTGGDSRKWGNLYWGANQSCLYNALFPTNRFELLDPLFHMYSSMRESCEIAAEQQWGSKGIFIPETVAFDGMAPLPEEIAFEMRDLYLLNTLWDERSAEFRDYAHTKMPFLSRWNWKKDVGWKEGRWHIDDKGAGPFGHVNHIFSRGAKIAYQYWLKYEYTLDNEWLRNEAYPMLRGVAEFYRNFPHLKKEKDGRYHIRHVNDNESVWDGHNTVEEIASMRGIFPVAIKASELLQTDPDLRILWKEVLDNLSPLPLISHYPASQTISNETWVRALPPITHGDGSRLPDPNTMPVWFFDLCTLESPPALLKTANATFNAYFSSGIDLNTSINVLSKLPVAGSLLGRVESTKYLIPNQIQTAETDIMRNRMDLREGFQTTSVQRLGRAAEALHYALCQSVPPRPGEESVIRIFPAWPREWDAQFKLLCRGGFLVSSEIRNTKIEVMQVESQAGSMCRIRNPWPGKGTVVYRNNKRWKTFNDDLIVFPTQKNERYTIYEK